MCESKKAVMESAIQTVVSVFLKSAKGKENLGGNDFQKLVKNQLHNIMTDTDSSEAVKEMRKGLDANQDGKVSFDEYMTLVGYLATTLSQQRTTAMEKPADSAAPAPENASAPKAEDGKAESKAHPEEAPAEAPAKPAAKSEKVEVAVKAEEPAPMVAVEEKKEEAS
uniref:EF-hand domain-containing protein n=1 Tax=Esox lucius TaxID=8010 RepID=A0AAY5KN04_ESOLU